LANEIFLKAFEVGPAVFSFILFFSLVYWTKAIYPPATIYPFLGLLVIIFILIAAF